ncbi:unnamed protein product, partial [Ilex paraguariensis]
KDIPTHRRSNTIMKPGLLTANPSSPTSTSNLLFFSQFCGLPRINNPISYLNCLNPSASQLRASSNPISPINSHIFKPSRLIFTVCFANSNVPESASKRLEEETSLDSAERQQRQWKVEVGSPSVPSSYVPPSKLSLSDQAFFLLAFIACTVL